MSSSTEPAAIAIETTKHLTKVKLTAEERRLLREKRRSSGKVHAPSRSQPNNNGQGDTDARIVSLLTKNEDEMLNFVAQINKLYEEKLQKTAPFMTWVFVGMQSAGKSTIMERFMNAVLNIVQEGTGTRCPLNVTCIHDGTLLAPVCELRGEELVGGGEDLTVNKVFDLITSHNKKLASELIGLATFRICALWIHRVSSPRERKERITVKTLNGFYRVSFKTPTPSSCSPVATPRSSPRPWRRLLASI